MDKYFFELYKEKSILLLVFLLILLISLTPGLPILGHWESFIYYHNFASLEIPVELRISRRGSLNEAALFSIGLSRIISEFLNTYPSLYGFRILSVLYGFLSLVIFFIVLRRWFDLTTSIFTTLLLSVNPAFHMEQQSMNSLMISFLGFVFLFERLQYLELNYRSVKDWLLLSIPLVLIVMHYGPGRIFATLFLFFWFIKLFFSLNKHRNGKKILSIFIKNFLFSVFLTIIFLILIDWKNLISIIQFYNIFIPSGSETIFSSNVFFGDFLQIFKINILILFESFTGLFNSFQSNHSAYISTGLRFEILNPLMFIFFLSGFVILIKDYKKKKLLLSDPSFSIISLFFICLIPLITSQPIIIDNNNMIDSTLSNYRMFFLFLPIYLIIAIFLSYILKKFAYKKNFVFLVVLFLTIIFAVSLKNIIDEKKLFTNKIQSLKNISNNTSYETWKDGTKYTNNLLKSFRNAQLHGFYYNRANEIKDLIDLDSVDFYILKLNTKQFHFIDDIYFSELNYVSVFFSFYLNNIGVENSWVQVINSNQPKHYIGSTYEPRFYSANVVVNNGILKYENLTDYKSYLRMNGDKIPKVILVTTEEELNFAMNYYKKNDITSYKLLNI